MLRHFPNGRTARPRIAVVVALSASLLTVTLTTPAPSLASGDDHHALTRQKAQLEHSLAGSHDDLDEVSQQLVTAQGRLDTAVSDLGAARARLDGLHAEVQAAVVREQQLEQALTAARQRLAGARQDLARGLSTVATQRSQLAAFAVSNATTQMTELSTLGLVVTADSTHAAIGEVQGANSALARQLADLQRLQANQVLLRYTEQRVRRAAADVAAQRDAAAANVAQQQALEAEAATAAGAVEQQVSDLQTRRTTLASAKAVELRRIRTMERERTNVEAQLRKIAQQRAAAHRAALAAAAAAARRAQEAAAARAAQEAAAARAEQEAAAARAAQQTAAARAAQETAAAEKAQSSGAAAPQASTGSSTQAMAPALDTGVLSWPVTDTYVTSPYGMRMHPILHIWELHDGTDFHATCGTPVYAAADGRVTSEYFNAGYGNRLMIDHGFVDGVSLWTSYNHLTSFVATTGESVSRGQLIAYSGTTGYST
ncbi:MAG: peptidoglycan DD-metalloendopeptidase family protein, partial [Nocardioidaceae bacterium]